MSGSIRTEKVAQTIREALMNLLIREVADPRLQGVLFTGVKVSNDLHLAWVYYDTQDGDSLSPAKQKEIENGLKRASPFFRRKIGEVMATKFTPELRFQRDNHSKEVAHLMQLFDEIKEK